MGRKAISSDPEEAGISEADRAVFFHSALDKAGVPKWGRVQRVIEETGCSRTTVAAWLKGALPRDTIILFKVCELFKIDIYEWAEGKSRDALDAEKLEAAIEKMAQYESLLGVKIPIEKRAALITVIYESAASESELIERLKAVKASSNSE